MENQFPTSGCYFSWQDLKAIEQGVDEELPAW